MSYTVLVHDVRASAADDDILAPNKPRHRPRLRLRLKLGGKRPDVISSSPGTFFCRYLSLIHEAEMPDLLSLEVSDHESLQLTLIIIINSYSESIRQSLYRLPIIINRQYPSRPLLSARKARQKWRN